MSGFPTTRQDRAALRMESACSRLRLAVVARSSGRKGLGAAESGLQCLQPLEGVVSYRLVEQVPCPAVVPVEANAVLVEFRQLP